MNRLVLLGPVGWGLSLNYVLLSDIFGFPYAIEVLWLGTALMLLAILSVLLSVSRFASLEENP